MGKEKDGTKVCKHCKSEIPAGAKICPQCRKKQGGIGKWIVIVLVVIVIGGAAASGGGSDDKKTSGSGSVNESGGSETKVDEKIEYISVTADDLSEALENNALKAQETYKDAYLKIKGKLGVIDSSGKYISIDTEELSFTNIQCYIQNDEQKEKIMEMSKGDPITVKGYCTDVGEIMGYYIDIDSVK